MIIKNFDKLFSIETDNLGEYTIKNEQYYPYEATPYPHLNTLFDAFEIHPYDHLVDIGSGKGRLLFYAHYHFNCYVTGIELDKHLYQLAIKNKTKYFKTFPRKKRSIKIIHNQAENYTIEKRDNIFYFFNPFSLNIFKNIIENIIYSAQKFPRTIKLILYYPQDAYEQFMQMNTPFKLKKTINIPIISKINPQERFSIYHMNPK